MAAAENIMINPIQNTVSFKLSRSLLKQIQNLAKKDGVSVEDLLVDFINQSMQNRPFQSKEKTLPPHLLTRNGYVNKI